MAGFREELVAEIRREVLYTIHTNGAPPYSHGCKVERRNWLTYAASVVTCSTVFTVVQLLLMPYCCHGAVQI